MLLFLEIFKDFFMARNRLFNNFNSVPTRGVRLVKNSEVIQIGDWITDEGAGVADCDAIGEFPLGLVTAVLDKNGVNMLQPNAAAVTGGSWVPATTVFTADSDNQTVDMVQVEYLECRPGMQFVATLDADKGTTTGSNKVGYCLSILTSDATLLDESTAVAGPTYDATTKRCDTPFRIVKATGEGLGIREVVVEVIASPYVGA